MKRFKFRLETVLRHREIVETQREQEFAEAQGRLTTQEMRLEQLRGDFARTLSERPGGARGEQFDAHAIHDRERYLETLLVAIGQQERRVEAARLIVEERRVLLVEAKQAREAVTRLRTHELAEYQAHVLKLEQEILDDQATLRYVRAAQETARNATPRKQEPAATPPKRKAA